MAEAALINNSAFDRLQYWRDRAINGLDASGKVVTPARWPHVGFGIACVRRNRHNDLSGREEFFLIEICRE